MFSLGSDPVPLLGVVLQLLGRQLAGSLTWSSQPPPGPPCRCTTGVPLGLPYCLMLSVWISDTTSSSDLKGCTRQRYGEGQHVGGSGTSSGIGPMGGSPTLMAGNSWA